MSATLAAFSAFLSIFSSFLSPVANKKPPSLNRRGGPYCILLACAGTLSRSYRHQRSSAIQLWSASISGAVAQCVQRAANQLAHRGRARGLRRRQLEVADGFPVALEQPVGVLKVDAVGQAEVHPLALRRYGGEHRLHVGPGGVLDDFPTGIDLLACLRQYREDHLAGLDGDLAHLRRVALEEGIDGGITGFRVSHRPPGLWLAHPAGGGRVYGHARPHRRREVDGTQVLALGGTRLGTHYRIHQRNEIVLQLRLAVGG